MRILVGTFEIGRHMYDLAAGLRALGHEVDTVAYYRNPQHPDLEYTHVLPSTFLSHVLTELQSHPVDTLLRHGDQLALVRKLLTDYDLYVFQFASSLLPGNADLPLLKQLGKQVACIFLGSEIRHWSGAEPVAGAYGMTAPDMLHDEPYTHLTTRLSNLRMAERYADAVFSVPFQSELAIRPYWNVELPVDLSLYEASIVDRQVPHIVHAPTRRSFKGTDAVLDALDRLRDEGERFELRLLEGVPNREVLSALTDADILIDELHAPHYGMLSLEAMASGCAIIGGNNPDYVPLMRASPVIHASAHTIYDQVKALLHDTGRRRALAEQGLAYVHARHGHATVAARLLEKLDLHAAFEYYPTFYATGYELPDGETLHPRLAELTSEIFLRHGLPADADPNRLVALGLADAQLREQPLVHWQPLVSNVKQEIWGWSPLHGDQKEPILSRAAMLVEATLEVRWWVEQGDSDRAMQLFQTCLEEFEQLDGVEEDVLLGMALAADALGYAEQARQLVSQGRLLFPTSGAMALCAAACGVEDAHEVCADEELI